MNELDTTKAVYVIFDGPPSHESGRFVEVEDEQGQSHKVGEWKERVGGWWALGPFVGAEEFAGVKAELEGAWEDLSKVENERDKALAALVVAERRIPTDDLEAYHAAKYPKAPAQ